MECYCILESWKVYWVHLQDLCFMKSWTFWDWINSAGNILIAKNHFFGLSINNIITKVNSSLRRKEPISMMQPQLSCNLLDKT